MPRGQAGSVRGVGTAACLGLHPPDQGRQRDERGVTALPAQSDPKTLLSTSPKEPRGRGTLPGLEKPPPRAQLLDTRPGPRMRAACPAHSGAREGPGAVGAMPGAGEGQGAGFGAEPPGSRTPRTPSAPPPLQPARKGKRNRGTASFSEAPPPHRARQDTQRPLPGTRVTLQRAGT